MTILETQMGRYEIRPFGSPKKFTIRGSVDDKDNFKAWLTSQDPAIRIEGFEEDIGDPKMEDDLDSALDLLFADEVFSTGNFGKVLPVRKIDRVEYEIGEVCNKAIDLYQKYASKYKD